MFFCVCKIGHDLSNKNNLIYCSGRPPYVLLEQVVYKPGCLISGFITYYVYELHDLLHLFLLLFPYMTNGICFVKNAKDNTYI